MRYFVNLEYDGSNYYGWSKQINKDTIQNHLEKKISKIFKEEITIHSSGRTDKGAHALNQYFHFESEMNFDLPKLEKVLNNLTNDDINIKKIKIVNDNFHSRFSAKNKTYLYVINDFCPNPFKIKYEFQINKKLDIKKLEGILNNFIGEYNFLSFSTTVNKNTIRKINWIKILRKNNIINIKINGNGFLRHMVRMIIGYSLLVYNEKKTIESISDLLLKPKKGKSAYKMPSNGLYLYNVYY